MSVLFPLRSFVENRIGRRFRKEVNLRKYQTVRSSPCHLQTPRSTNFSECFLHCFSQSFLTRRSVHLICVIAVHILQYRGTVQWKWCYMNCTAISSYSARTVTHFLSFWPGFSYQWIKPFWSFLFVRNDILFQNWGDLVELLKSSNHLSVKYIAVHFQWMDFAQRLSDFYMLFDFCNYSFPTGFHWSSAICIIE